MPNEMTFQQEGDYIVCYIDGVEVSRAKKAADGTSTAEVIDIINDQIKANPTLAGTEPNLEGLEVSGDKYAIPAQIPVVANPTLAGTEADLTGIEVGGTKYKVSSGGGGATLEDIVDSAGNRRFIEGEITIELDSTFDKVFSFNYKKWSLSGTHLMIVLSMVNIFSGGDYNLASTKKIASIELPEWIINKIVPLYNDIVYSNMMLMISGNTSSGRFRLTKENNKLYIYSNAPSIAANSTTRIQFDLLIDADYSD